MRIKENHHGMRGIPGLQEHEICYQNKSKREVAEKKDFPLKRKLFRKPTTQTPIVHTLTLIDRMEEFTRRHFFYHGASDVPAAERAACQWCQLRAFRTHAQYPVTIVNEEDNCVLPTNFRFTEQVEYGRGVHPAEASFRSGCDCGRGGEGCHTRQCLCLSELDSSDDDDEEEYQEEEKKKEDGDRRLRRRPDTTTTTTSKTPRLFAYNTSGPNFGMLKESLLHSKAPIYECHSACACHVDPAAANTSNPSSSSSASACPNHVVASGRKVALEIFRTPTRGWGVRCPEPLRKGQFVDCYVGEVITADEAQGRRRAAEVARKKDVYLFALDKFYDVQSYDERLRQPPFLVDGEFVSGPTRFINHSCDPNLRIFARVGDHADKNIHDVAFFAIRDIPRYTELTFDYVDGVVDDDNDPENVPPASSSRDVDGMTRCLCGSENCRGFLW